MGGRQPGGVEGAEVCPTCAQGTFLDYKPYESKSLLCYPQIWLQTLHHLALTSDAGAFTEGRGEPGSWGGVGMSSVKALQVSDSS